MGILCPCGSERLYTECCQALHDGANAGNALLLMRSRYAAYAMGRADYIIRTTHPRNPNYRMDVAGWVQDIKRSYGDTQFQKLEIVDFVDGDEVAYVTFVAHLRKNGKDVGFCEKSRFEKVDGRWLYHSGDINPPEGT